MVHLRCALLAALALVPTSLGAQRRDSTACADKLPATADSSIVQVSVHVVPFDTTQHLRETYAEMIAEGLRQYFVLPHDLSLSVYDDRLGKRAFPTVKGVYRVWLHGNGHLTQPKTFGGTRTEPFDGAVLSALVTLDTSLLLPPVDSTFFRSPDDSLDVRIRIQPDATWPLHGSAPAPTRGFLPLVRLRVPMLAVTKPSALARWMNGRVQTL